MADKDDTNKDAKAKNENPETPDATAEPVTGTVPEASPAPVSETKPAAETESAPARKPSIKPAPVVRKPARKKRFLPVPLIILALLLLIVGAHLLFKNNDSNGIKAGQYQAVFFNNGQVYFGKLENLNDKYLKLTGIFYLQSPNAASVVSGNNPRTANSPDIQLVKLGNEVHGPEDEMIIGKEQVQFFENLKKDGKVTRSIEDYYKKK